MKITEKDVSYVADLASLELTAEERTRMVHDLGAIIGYIDRLNELNTAGVEPMAQVGASQRSGRVANKASFEAEKAASPAKMVESQESDSEIGEDHMRDDRTLPSIGRAAVMKNAPQPENGFFKVPRVISTSDE